MAKSGPVIIIDDDGDDEAVLKEALRELEVLNEVMAFENSESVLRYLRTTTDKPLIIFCDINLPKISGLEFKLQIDKDPALRRKSIPFIFYSTAVRQEDVNNAFTKMTVQGFFQKPSSFKDVKQTVKLILDYWLKSKHPNE